MLAGTGRTFQSLPRFEKGGRKGIVQNRYRNLTSADLVHPCAQTSLQLKVFFFSFQISFYFPQHPTSKKKKKKRPSLSLSLSLAPPLAPQNVVKMPLGWSKILSHSYLSVNWLNKVAFLKEPKRKQDYQVCWDCGRILRPEAVQTIGNAEPAKSPPWFRGGQDWRKDTAIRLQSWGREADRE